MHALCKMQNAFEMHNRREVALNALEMYTVF